MPYAGDYTPSKVVYFKFTTRSFTTGIPFTLAGSPALRVYKDNDTGESSAGITLTVDFDSKTGLNHVAIDTSADGSFYAAGSNFDVVISAGTVDSVSVVNEVVGSFSISKVGALRPTTADRTVDVTAGGGLAELTTAVADSVAADGSRPSYAQALLMITRFLMEKSLSGTTLTVKKEDGSTSSMTFTLDSETDPTSITRAS
jgi:hypothetical protein